MSLFFLSGCGGSALLEKDFVRSVVAPPDAESHVIYCSDNFALTANGTILEKKNVVIRVGANAAGFPRGLAETEDATEKILNIEGRIIHADGSSTRIPSGEFYRVNTSGKERIAEEYVRAAAIPDRLGTGDLVETACLIEHTFPQMGIVFSPSDLGYPADNVSCSIETLPGQDIRYHVVNSNVVPSIQNTETGKKYSFAFPPHRTGTKKRHLMRQKNLWPMVFATPEAQTWVSFGDWYLNLIQDRLTPGKALADTTARIIEGKATPKERLDAIFEFCKRSVRYEQMYLENGEFIPNGADAIFARRFGDCKDYATLMHAMASSAGIPTELVLCYRGRGRMMFEEALAFEFNHVILHYSDNGKDCWYDATDRLGLSGTPSFDLANARVLVVEKGRSRFVTIEESPDNLATITGQLSAAANEGLKGPLTVTFSHQYAVEFSWEQEHLNGEDMRATLTQMLKQLLNSDLMVDSLKWSATSEAFTVTASCTCPDCLVKLGGKTYTSALRVFPNLLPDEIDSAEAKSAFYCPYLNRLAMDVSILPASQPLHLQMHYQMPAGPFDDTTRPAFLVDLEQAHAQYTQSYSVTGNLNP